MKDLAKFVGEIWAIAPDFGPEARLLDTLPISAKDVLPSWTDPQEPPSRPHRGAQAEASMNADFSDEDGEDAQRGQQGGEFSDDDLEDELLCFCNMILNPGAAHINHNASNSLETICPTYGKRVDQLIVVCDLVRKRKHRQRLRGTCFNDELGPGIWKEYFAGFKGAPHKKRFATISFAIPFAMSVGPHLRARWDAQAFTRGPPAGPRHGEGEGGSDQDVRRQCQANLLNLLDGDGVQRE